MKQLDSELSYPVNSGHKPRLGGPTQPTQEISLSPHPIPSCSLICGEECNHSRKEYNLLFHPLLPNKKMKMWKMMRTCWLCLVWFLPNGWMDSPLAPWWSLREILSWESLLSLPVSSTWRKRKGRSPHVISSAFKTHQERRDLVGDTTSYLVHMGPCFLENLNTLDLTLSEPPQEEMEEEIGRMGANFITGSWGGEDNWEIHASTTKGGTSIIHISSSSSSSSTSPRVHPLHVKCWKADTHLQEEDRRDLSSHICQIHIHIQTPPTFTSSIKAPFKGGYSTPCPSLPLSLSRSSPMTSG